MTSLDLVHPLARRVEIERNDQAIDDYEARHTS